MERQEKPGIVFRFHRPKGAREKPSEAMAEALQKFSEAEEMRDFVAEARVQRRDVVVEVFHARDGHPLLIHTSAVPSKTRNSKEKNHAT